MGLFGGVGKETVQDINQDVQLWEDKLDRILNDFVGRVLGALNAATEAALQSWNKKP
jgi:hypothetical protein